MNEVTQTIDKCCICGGKTQITCKIPFAEVYGMAKEYTQQVDICPRCGFIFTANPFNEELLANRYKKMSKFEFDRLLPVTEPQSGYAVRSGRQYDFVSRLLQKNDFESILEIGASRGYNLNLYLRVGG